MAKFLGMFNMTILEYLTNGLNLSTAQCEAIKKLADVCEMKSLLEMARPRAASNAIKEFLAQNNPSAPAAVTPNPANLVNDAADDNDDENYQSIFSEENNDGDEPVNLFDTIDSHSHSIWGNDLNLRKAGKSKTTDRFNADVAAKGYDPNEFIANSTTSDANVDTRWSDTDTSVFDRYDVVDSSENKSGTNHQKYHSVGGLGDAWLFGDSGDEGMDAIQSDVTVDELKNAQKADDDYLSVTNDTDLSLLVSRICKLAKMPKDRAVALVNKCTEIADRANSEFAGNLSSEYGMKSFGAEDLNNLNQRLTGLINRVYKSPIYNNRLKMTEYIDEYLSNQPNSIFAQTLKDVKRDPRIQVKSSNGIQKNRNNNTQSNFDELNKVLGNFYDAGKHTPENELTGRSGLSLELAIEDAKKKLNARKAAGLRSHGWTSYEDVK